MCVGTLKNLNKKGVRMEIEFNLKIAYEPNDMTHPYRVEDNHRIIYRFCKTWDEAECWIELAKAKGGI